MIGKGILIEIDADGKGGAPDAKKIDDQGADTKGKITKASTFFTFFQLFLALSSFFFPYQ